MTATRTLTAAVIALLALTGTASAQTAEKPDLVVKEIKVDQGDNEVKVTVKNVGDKKADDSKVKLEIRVVVRGKVFPVFSQVKNVDDLGRNDDDKVKFDVNFAQVKAQVEAVKAQIRNNPALIGAAGIFGDRIEQ